LNPVEIEQAITELAARPFDRANFPYAFLEAFGNKDTTRKRLRAGASNKSDVGGVLQTNNIHILTCDVRQMTAALQTLRDSPATAKAKAKFILATDGVHFEAEHLRSGETVACAYADFPDHFGLFLPLATRAFRFKRERGRNPSLDAQDACERRMAEGAVAFMRFKMEGRYA
jgi:hypothetical protein